MRRIGSLAREGDDPARAVERQTGVNFRYDLLGREVFGIIQDGLHGDTRPDYQPGAAHLAGDPFGVGTFAPIDHDPPLSLTIHEIGPRPPDGRIVPAAARAYRLRGGEFTAAKHFVEVLGGRLVERRGRGAHRIDRGEGAVTAGGTE